MASVTYLSMVLSEFELNPPLNLCHLLDDMTDSKVPLLLSRAVGTFDKLTVSSIFLQFNCFCNENSTSLYFHSCFFFIIILTLQGFP